MKRGHRPARGGFLVLRLRGRGGRGRGQLGGAAA